MEKARHRRTKSATSVEGNIQVHKQKVNQYLVADSRSYNDGISKDDLVTSQFSQNTMRRGNGTPIKKLLAEEMAKEGESKRRSPNVIARLMGLDGLPSPQHGHKQHRKLLDKHQQQNASRSLYPDEYLYEDRLSRKSSVDQKDFKDVYEDLEASHVTNRRFSSKWSADSGLIKPEMELIQQKFMDAKRLSCSENLHVSKEFDDTLEMLDSNKDLLLRYLQQPDSLFVKPLPDFRVTSSRSYDHTVSLETTNSRAKGSNSQRGNLCRYNISSRPKREDGLLLQSHSRRNSYSPCRNPSKNYLDLKNEDNVIPTRIVVLKPNVGKTSNSISSVSSPESSHAHPSSYRKHLKCTTAKSDEISSKKRNSSSRVFSSSPKSREDRAIAREVTRRMRENFGVFGGGLNILTHTGARGYAGDESSYDPYESDSSGESGGKTVSSSTSLHGNNWCKHSSSCLNESLVSKEAKKRMSERWKMTHKSQDVESFGKGGGTLGEMLAITDTETRHETLDAAMTPEGDIENVARRNSSSGRDSPLGISSRDGWKDGYVKDSSISRSLQPSPLSCRNHQVSKESRGNLSKKDHSLGDISSSRQPHPCHNTSSDDTRSSPDLSASLIQADINYDKEVQHENDIMLFQMAATAGSCTISGALPDAGHESLTLALDCSSDLQFKHSGSMRECYNSSAREDTMSQQKIPVSLSEDVASAFQCPGPEMESSESSKEADHPSPVSVLEVSFAEDVSSGSDCFERVNAELHELRMQLQLLKMESGGYADTAILGSSIEDAFHHSEIVGEGCLVGGASWEAFYADEVLFNSGLEDFDPDGFAATCYDPECLLDPWVFDNLEKNYVGEPTRMKYERKLLFDRINLALLEMFKHYVNPLHWVRPICSVNLQRQKHGVREALLTYLTNQETEVNGKNPEKVLDREMCWLGFRDDIDILGKEIEKMLIDDLIGEILIM